MDVTALDRTFGRGDHIRVAAGKGGLACVRVANAAAEAEIYLQGAHVTAFRPMGHAPVVWTSAASLFQAGKAIRGGIPICWPWFGPHGTDATFPAHGFARTATWELVATDDAVDGSTVTFRLRSPAPLPGWFPASFALTYTVEVGARLRATLAYENASAAPQTIGEALHSYLAVSDVRHVAITGLAGVSYDDKVARARATEGSAPIVLAGETDRVYLSTVASVDVVDPGLKRTLRVSKAGSASTVIWNPWSAKARQMSDFGDDEWPGMVCVEAANAHDDRATVAPGETHVLATEIAVIGS